LDNQPLYRRLALSEPQSRADIEGNDLGGGFEPRTGFLELLATLHELQASPGHLLTLSEELVIGKQVAHTELRQV